MISNNGDHFFYVLECRDGSLYAGYTNDLEKRVNRHNAGVGSKYTRAKRPVKLVFSHSFECKRKAMSTEAQFKKLTRVQKLAVIAGDDGGAFFVQTKEL